MGVFGTAGSKYAGPHATVWWLLLPDRSANNVEALWLAAILRDIPAAILAGDDPHTTPVPDPGWHFYGDDRVMAWNGGASDVP